MAMKILFVSLFVGIILLTGCQKEIIPDDNIINSPVNLDSNYLSKIYAVFYGNGIADTDTSGTRTYFYDNQKRVIKVIDSLSINSSPLFPVVVI